MTKKLLMRIGLFILVVGLIGLGIAAYLFNMPHRDVQASATDYEVTAANLVAEYLADPNAANQKYLNEEGESKILAISGTVWSVDEDLNGQKVVVLKEKDGQAGVSCTFTRETSGHAARLLPGEIVTLKGVIHSGAGYDADLDLYEDVIVEKCDVLIVQ